ncbi:MAG: hypothetical protein JWO51_4113, partial [Rhodospirillales bacterium]|nr:hypothetical protein [Rhodospirillales bacterium]
METVGTFREVLGESPVWCDRDQALYWADIRRRLIRRHAIETGETHSWEFPELVGCFALRQNGGFVVALQSRIAFFDPATGEIETVATPEAGKPGHRFNDGKCDPAGRFLAGSMEDATRAPSGTLWSLAASGTCRALIEGCSLPNGLAWSPDGARMYFSDTMSGVVMVYPYDVANGTTGPGEVFATIGDGGPDGATVDAEGYYWSAIYGGWRVERYAPDGALDRTIRLPVQNPTSCCFGG